MHPRADATDAGLAALIFDVDGTLADTEETHRQAFNYAFLHFGLGWEWQRPLYRELLKTSGGKERIAGFIDTLQLPAGEAARLRQLVPAIHREKTRLFAELIADGRCPLRPGIVRLIDDARGSGVRLAIASTTTPENVHALLTRHLGDGALRMFACIACGDHVEHKKPAPDIYELALATLGCPARRCIAFEDSANGLRAAKASGLYTVVTPSQWTMGEDFAGADLVLSHLGDPDHPLPPAQAAAAGGPWLGLPELRGLHAAAIGVAAQQGARP
ncbi:MAG TPA: HAD family hydrolase [Casimicrobiaceae bacterium]|nr:HAD family hydrolase [Casimicrobiaceae bacterium]